MSYGDQFTLITIQQNGVSGNDLPTTQEAPVPKDPDYPVRTERESLQAFKDTADSSVDDLFKRGDAAKIEHTDILATLSLASQAMRDAGSRETTLIILSDMLQSSHGIEMEHAARMPSPNWIQRQKVDGLVPSLNHACMLAVGADSNGIAGAEVFKFWQQYFSAAGTTLSSRNYLSAAPEASRNFCGS